MRTALRTTAQLTAIRHLARIASGTPIAKHLKSRPNLAQTFKRCPPPRTFVFGKPDLLLLTGLGVRNLRHNGTNLVVKNARLLCLLSTNIALGCISVLQLPCHIEVSADVFRSLAHGLQSISGLTLRLHNLWYEGLQPLSGSGHAFCANGQSAFDRPHVYLVCNILDSLETGGTEAVDG